MGVLYLLLLIAGIGCMLLLDQRFRLFFWHDPAIALLVTAVGTALFLLWDVAGIAAGVFLLGESAVASGVVLAPQLPLEEPVFIVFLVLCTMVVFTGSARLLAWSMRSRGVDRGPASSQSADGQVLVPGTAERSAGES